MKKGSSARKCRVCGKVIAWVYPTGESVLGIRTMGIDTKPDFATDNKGYICKACKAQLTGGKTA